MFLREGGEEARILFAHSPFVFVMKYFSKYASLQRFQLLFARCRAKGCKEEDLPGAVKVYLRVFKKRVQ